MSNQDNVLGCIRRLLWARFGVPTADVSLTTTIEDVGIDSLDAVELVMELEKRFDVTITDHEASQWTTVEDVVASIRAKTGGEPGAEAPGSKGRSTVSVETTYADRGCIEPVEVAHDEDDDVFLIGRGGEYLDLELSRREARGLHACLDAALASHQ